MSWLSKKIKKDKQDGRNTNIRINLYGIYTAIKWLIKKLNK